MSYNPGVSDISGQILARGVSGMVAQHAQNMETLRANEQKRRLAAGQIQGLLASDPQIAQQADPALLSKMSAGKANLNDTLQLLGTLTTMRGARDDQTRMQIEQMKSQQVQAQTQSLLAELAARRQNEQALRAAAEQLQAETPEDYARRGGMVMRNPAPQRTEADPNAALANYLKNRGNDPTMIQYLSSLAASRAKADAPRPGVFTYPNEAALEKDRPRKDWDFKVEGIDPRTGAITVSGLNPRGPAQAVPNQFGAALDEGLGKQVSSLIEKVPDYTSTLEQVQRARAAISDGASVGGGNALSKFKLGVAQTINGLAGSQVFKTSDTELARTSFSDMALTAASRMKNQGQITEPERQLLAQTVAQLGDSPETINYVMNYMEAAAQRNLAKAQAANKLRVAGNRDAGAYSSILTNWETENPIDLEKIGGAPKSKAPKAGATPTINFPGEKTAAPALPPGWSIRN